MVVTLTCPPCQSLWFCIPSASAVGWGFGECHLQKMGVRHLHAVTLFSCASLHNWTLQYLQLLRVIETVCSPPHIPKFLSLLCIGYHKSLLASSIQVFSNPTKQQQASTSFLSSVEHVTSTKMLSQGRGWRRDTTPQRGGRELVLIPPCNEMVIWHSSNNKNK